MEILQAHPMSLTTIWSTTTLIYSVRGRPLPMIRSAQLLWLMRSYTERAMNPRFWSGAIDTRGEDMEGVSSAGSSRLPLSPMEAMAMALR